MAKDLYKKLKELYFKKPKFIGLNKKFDDCKYHIDIHWNTSKYPPKNTKQNISLRNKNQTWFDSITIKSSYGKNRIFSLDKKIEHPPDNSESPCKDIKHVAELIFLLAAKQKYDDLTEKHTEKQDWDQKSVYNNSHLLYTQEISNLKKQYRTKVPPTVWRNLYQKLKSIDSFNFLSELNQLYHLIGYCGNIGQSGRDPSVFGWLNILAEDIKFVEQNGHKIEDTRLKGILSIFFDECLLGQEELNVIYRERGINEKLLKFGNKTIRPCEISNVPDVGCSVFAKPANSFAEKHNASVFLNSIGEAIIPRTFLHFFDIHFLREKGFKDEINLFVNELKLATQIAISTSKVILIPAPSYIESPICRNIIDMHKELFPYGIIFIVGNASCIEEFAANRLSMYPMGSSHHVAYSNISTYNMHPPFYTRKRNTTHDISLDWIKTLECNNFFSSLQEQLGVSLPPDFEDMWGKVPDRLEGRAIIYDYISPLFKDLASHPSFKFQINRHLNNFYFDSYITELDTGVVEDLIYLESGNVVPSNGYAISYAKFITKLRQNGIYDDFVKSVGWKLLEFRNSPFWLDCYSCSLNKTDGDILK